MGQQDLCPLDIVFVVINGEPQCVVSVGRALTNYVTSQFIIVSLELFYDVANIRGFANFDNLGLTIIQIKTLNAGF